MPVALSAVIADQPGRGYRSTECFVAIGLEQDQPGQLNWALNA